MMINLFLIFTFIAPILNKFFFWEKNPWPSKRNFNQEMQNITQIGNYSVIFDQIDCEIRINHTFSKTEIYRAKASQMISTGLGDIDNKAEKIIQNGNVARYPRAKIFSTSTGICPIYNELSVGSLDLHYSIVQLDGEQIVNIGHFIKREKIKIPTRVRISLAEDNMGILLELSIKDEENQFNFISTLYESQSNEEIYGLGVQYTEWNFKGKIVPIISSEGGIGRGLEPITFFCNLDKGSGGNSMTTYAPSYSYITNKNRAITLNSTALGYYDFYSDATQARALLWHEKTIYQTINYGESIKSLGAINSKKIGTMKVLPDWIMDGAIVSLQGGFNQVNETATRLIDAKVPIVAFWMQDWVGIQNCFGGQRLKWNWKLNKEYYPHWNELVQNWGKRGIRPFIYINPYLSNETDSNSQEENQFNEAYEKGYFIMNQDKTPQLLKSGSIKFGTVDLTNPEARIWIKNIIKENMIKEAGAWGWMHDFGEYVPLNSRSFDGTDPIVRDHNNYPYLWAEIVKEVIEESDAPQAKDIVYFMRSGQTRSPPMTKLFWMGDQLPTFDQYDGLWSAIIGQLNGGLSGFTLGHSDIGGYTTVWVLNGLYKITRSKELLLRWIEANTFSDMIMRTHVGVNPNHMYQIYDDPDTTAFFSKFVNIHRSLKNYKMELMKENERTGVAPLRALLVEFENDSEARKIKDQFMLGSDLMMAPILIEGKTSRDVYMPKDTWTNYFTLKEYDFSSGGAWLKEENAPIGEPLVFLRGSLRDNLIKKN